MGWLGRSRFRARDQAERGTLRHPTSTLVIGLVGFVFFAALASFSAAATSGPAPWWATVMFAGFAAMSAAMLLDYFMARHDLSDDGIAYRKLLGSSGFIRWSELKEVRYASAMKWFHLETAGGAVVRISAMLVGLPEFAQAALKFAPAQAMDPETLQILQETAAGNPPSLWA